MVILKTKGKIPLSGVPFSLLLCSLYNLCENNTLFKRFNIRNDIFLNVNNEDIISNNNELSTNVYALINKKSLRRFVFRLLKPLISQPNLLEYFPVTGESKDNVELLGKYLRKFKYNYYLYFSDQTVAQRKYLTEKELNSSAIKILFLLVGI